MKQEWTLFKPLSNNKLIIGIQNLISEQIDLKYLKKIYSTFTIENITLLRSINSQKTIAKLCKIPTLEIIQNAAFNAFFRIIVSCYGTYPHTIIKHPVVI